MRLRRWAMGALATVLLLLIWGVAVEPRVVLDVRTFETELPHLPSSLDGVQVAVIGDIQIGMWLANAGMVRRAVDDIVTRRPDLVCILGDFIYSASGPNPDRGTEEVNEEFRERRDDIGTAIRLVRPLAQSGIPTFAVLGNHDYAMMWPDSVPQRRLADALAAALQRAGIRVLRNEAVPLRLRGDAVLYVAGIAAAYPHADRPGWTLQQVPAGLPRVVFMHNPDSFAAIPAGDAPLAIAGHTHGGQVRLPFLPNWSWLVLTRDAPVHTDGWIPNYGEPGNRLYVNRGIGFSVLPIRINCPPELTFFRLRTRPISGS